MSQAPLFERGEFGDEHHAADFIPQIELEHVPEARKVERLPSLTLSFDSEEDRQALLDQIGIRVTERGPRVWICGVTDTTQTEMDL